MVKTGDNTWKTYTLIEGRNPDGSDPTDPLTPPVASTMNFDSSGNLTSVTTPVVPATIPPSVTTSPDLKVTGWIPGNVTNGTWKANGAASGVVTVSMDKTTQYNADTCLLYTSPSPRDRQKSRMPSSA